MPDEPIFDTLSVLQMDNKTGRIAMVVGGFYDDSDPIHAGVSRIEAEEISKCMMMQSVFPNFRGGYTVTWCGLSEKQNLIIAICDPDRGKGPVPIETIAWCDENSILSNNIPDLG